MQEQLKSRICIHGFSSRYKNIALRHSASALEIIFKVFEMIKIYGIPNCDTMKKARKWLEANDVDYDFHDYKKLGVPDEKLKRWVKQAGWEKLLNKRGTTWRKLDHKVKDSIDEQLAIKIMLENPSIIKRPVLESGKTLLVGFNASDYLQLIG